MAASLIERLPDEDDPQRPMEESVAKNVAFVAYVGMWCNWGLTDFSPVLFQVALILWVKKIIILFMISLIASDCVVRSNDIPRNGTISGSPEESSSRN